MIYLAYALAAAWSVGCLIVAVRGGLYLLEDGDLVSLALALIGLPCAFFLVCAPWWFIADSVSPDLVTLKRGEWECTAYVTNNSVVPISTGKTTTFVPVTSQDCSQYNRITR